MKRAPLFPLFLLIWSAAPAPARAAQPSTGAIPRAANTPAAPRATAPAASIPNAGTGGAPLPLARSSGSGTTKPEAGPAAFSRLASLIGPDYKKPRDLPDTFFNPFKVEATTELMLQKKGAAVTEQSVAEAVGHRGVSGILFGANGGFNQVIIGDQVFRVGDELTFPEGDAGASAPLVAGASVILREIGEKNLVFDYSAEGEAGHRSTYSLRNFWRP